MRRPSRRSALAVTAIAALGTGGALSSVASATAAPQSPTAAQTRGLLDGLAGTLGLPATSSPLAVVNSILAGTPANGVLSEAQVDQLLTAITTDPASLPSLLTTGIPIPVLGQLLADSTPNLDQLGALLGALSSGDVAAALATLTPAQQQQAKTNMAAAQQQFAKLQPKAPVKQTFFTAYRASVTSIKVSKNRRKATIKVNCPASSPKGCYVQVSPKVGGKKAGSMKAFLLARNTTQSGSISLSSSAAKRLKKGGSVQMTAKTALSSLSSATKTVKVAKSKSK